jgi:tripartite-type tricarboxylate transporter receptor subunit TctC
MFFGKRVAPRVTDRRALHPRWGHALCAAVMVAACGITAAHAQGYPSRGVQIVVPYPAGGSSDVIARLLGAKLGESLRQSFIVDNRPGAGTLIGTVYVAKAAPDAYTLLLADVPFTVNPAVAPDSGYDPVRDFTPISLLGVSAQFMYSNPVRFKSLADLIAGAKTNPGKVIVATTGNGTTSHIMTEMLQTGAGVRFLQVPYKGSAPALNDVAGGQVDAAFSTLASAAPLVAARKLRIIGVTAPARLPAYPEVPTFAEMGVGELIVEHWWGLLGPAGLAPEIVQRLQAEVAKAVAAPDIRERFAALDVEPRASTPEQFRSMVESYYRRWSKVVRENNIKAN